MNLCLTCFDWDKSVTVKCKYPQIVRNVGYVRRYNKVKDRFEMK